MRSIYIGKKISRLEYAAGFPDVPVGGNAGQMFQFETDAATFPENVPFTPLDWLHWK
jgi:hypothetical protein